MAQRLTCPQGHQWDQAAGDPQTLDDASMDAQTVCPVCGADEVTLVQERMTVARHDQDGDTQQIDGFGDNDLNDEPTFEISQPSSSSSDSLKPTFPSVPGENADNTSFEIDRRVAQASSEQPDDATEIYAPPQESSEEATEVTQDWSGRDASAASQDGATVDYRVSSQSATDESDAGTEVWAGSEAAEDDAFSLATEVQGSPRKPKLSKTSIPGYEIMGELGRGGMGVVYKARQKGLNRLVAFKMILHGSHSSKQELLRFRIEAEAVARMQHPNIVQIYEVSEHDGCPFFSLEYVDGDSLSKKVKDDLLAVRHAAKLMQSLADAMDYAHRRGIIHRDLKPANVLLMKDGTPKITDFGLAKRLEEEDTGQTKTGAIMGTPSYMSPEQAAGKIKELGPPADVYSLGAILYDLLTGRPPFRGETVLDTLQLVRTEEPVRPVRLQPKVPRDLETICLTCLQKDANKRYASAAALAEDLRRFLEGEPIAARPTPAWERAWKWAKRRPTAAAFVAFGLVTVVGLIVGGVAFGQYQRQRRVEADELRNDAVDARTDAEKQRDRADQRAYEAERNLMRAMTNFRHAEDAVEQMMTRVAQERLAREPRMERVRRDLLEKALKFHERFLDENSIFPEVRWQTARSYQSVGNVREQLGESEAAKAAYLRSVDLLKDLTTRDPDKPIYRRDLSGAYNKLGVLHHSAGRRQEAGEAFDKALAIKEELAGKFPDDPEYRWELAKSLNDRGILLQTGQRTEEAEKSLKQALAHFDRLVKEHADRADFQLERSRTLRNLGALQAAARQPKKAQEAYELALKQLRDLVAKSPDMPEYRKELAVGLLNQGAFMHLNAAFREAESSYTESKGILQDLAVKFPKVPEYRHELGLCHGNLGKLYSDQQKPKEAEASRRQAIDLFLALTKEVQGEPIYRQELARNYHELGFVAASAERSSEAERVW